MHSPRVTDSAESVRDAMVKPATQSRPQLSDARQQLDICAVGA